MTSNSNPEQSTHRAALDAITRKYVQELKAYMSSLSDDEAKKASAAVKRLNNTNCVWYLGMAKPLLAEAVRDDDAGRHNERERSEEQG